MNAVRIPDHSKCCIHVSEELLDFFYQLLHCLETVGEDK